MIKKLVKSCQLFSKNSPIVDVRLGSKYSYSVNHQMAYFVPSESWIFRKSGPRTLRKSRPYAKIHYIGQKRLYDKLQVADFKYDYNFFKKLRPKNT